jgi:hypothetical protein
MTFFWARGTSVTALTLRISRTAATGMA